MRVLSLFDGISGTQQALKKLGITPSIYFASEIDKYAIQITMKNFPNTIQLGDVTKLHDFDFGEIDLMTWGSPCQDLSIAKKERQGLNGVRSGLFYDAVKIWERVKPKYWLMENVASMPKESMHEISRILGVYPITINSALVTAQNRVRYYWTNIKGNSMLGEVENPKDRGILLKDIVESGVVDNNKSYCLDANYWKGSSLKHSQEKKVRQQVCEPIRIGELGKGSQGDRVYSLEGKSVSLSANGGGQGAKTGLYCVRQVGVYKATGKRGKKVDGGTEQVIEYISQEKTNNLSTFTKDNLIMQDYTIRKLTPVECERLQGFPDNYTSGISNTQRYKCLGNSFTVPVIEHILSFILCQNK